MESTNAGGVPTSIRTLNEIVFNPRLNEEELHYWDTDTVIRHVLHFLDERTLVRVTQTRMGLLSEASAHEIIEEMKRDECFCYDETHVSEMIIIPCCGKRCHIACIEKCLRCPYCRQKKPVLGGWVGFQSWVSYFAWVDWRDRLERVLTIEPARAIVPLIHALRSERSNIVKEYAAMRLFDLTTRDFDYIVYMVNASVIEPLITILHGGGGDGVKSTAWSLLHRLFARDIITAAVVQERGIASTLSVMLHTFEFDTLDDASLLLLFDCMSAREIRIFILANHPSRQTQLLQIANGFFEQLAVRFGFVDPPPCDATSWFDYFRWIESRRHKAWMPIAAGVWSSFFVADDGELMSCGMGSKNLNHMGHEYNPAHVYENGIRVDQPIRDEDGNEIGFTTNNGMFILEPTKLSCMRGIRFRNIVYGGVRTKSGSPRGISVAVSDTGEVYTWGNNFYSTLGHDTEQGEENGYNEHVAGDNDYHNDHDDHDDADEEGEEYEAEVEIDDIYADGILPDYTYLPKKIESLSSHRILSVATGGFHCIAVTEHGEIFSWGWNRNGQCGHDLSTDVVRKPRRVQHLSTVRADSASAGQRHSLVVTETGEVYTFGMDDYGQLGRGETVTADDFPRRVIALCGKHIVAVAAGMDHSLALTDAGQVYAWGRNDTRQLGADYEGLFIDQPREVHTLIGKTKVKVQSLAAGTFTSCAVTTTGELLTWGMGPELGHGGMHGHSGTRDKPKHVRINRNTIETHEPAQSSIEDEFVIAVSITDNHTLVITQLPGSTRAPLCVFGWGEVECNCFPATTRDPVSSEYTLHYMPSNPTWDGVPWPANGPFHPPASIYISDWSRFVRDNDDRTLIVKYTQFSHGPIHPSKVLQSTDGRSTLIDGRVIDESDTLHGKLRLLTKRLGVQLELNQLRAIWADQAAYA